MPNINDAPFSYIVFRAKPDGGRTRVGMYETEADARDAVTRSIERWREESNPVYAGELASDDPTEPRPEGQTPPEHSVWRGTWERIAYADDSHDDEDRRLRGSLTGE